LEEFIENAQGFDMVDNYWYMQDGAISHRTQPVFDILSTYFRHRIVGLDARRKTGFGIDWPPYSPDLNGQVNL
jgi:hypothetical protein